MIYDDFLETLGSRGKKFGPKLEFHESVDQSVIKVNWVDQLCHNDNNFRHHNVQSGNIFC